MHLFKALLFLTIANTLTAEEKRIFSHDTLWKEDKFRDAVRETYPGLKYGYYHWTGHWLQGALEDFENNRVLLLFPDSGVGEAKFHRNGIRLKIPVGKPATIKIAGELITDKGIVDSPESARDLNIGYWLPLKITDRLKIEYRTTHPAKVTFKGTYDPDNGWQTSCISQISDQDHRKPAEVYEISHQSLIKQVLSILKTKDRCLIRLRSRRNLIAEKGESKPPADLHPMEIILTDKITYGSEQLALDQLDSHLETYRAVAVNADLNPKILCRLTKESDDQLFRKILNILRQKNFDTVFLIAPED